MGYKSQHDFTKLNGYWINHIMFWGLISNVNEVLYIKNNSKSNRQYILPISFSRCYVLNEKVLFHMNNK